jgi:DNA-directed RNA polymerase subunit RPC12/RpoP
VGILFKNPQEVLHSDPKHVILGAVSRELTRLLLSYRCSDCGYGASAKQAPARCPMCGGSAWMEERYRPFGDLTIELASAARRAAVIAGADADAPLVRELVEASVFPGVPLS